ncbi:MAG: deoxycytidylate deaminase [Christensenellales bacterium]
MVFDKWDHRFMQLAQTVASWSSCYQENRKVGAVIVRDRRIMTTGYNGAPVGVTSCMERGECLRRIRNIPSGTQQELCYATHAEQNAIAQAARMGVEINGATLYCTHQPCVICAKLMINAGIRRVVYKNGYPDEFSRQICREAGLVLQEYCGP